MPLKPLDLQDEIDRLLDSNEPSIRWKIRVNVLGEDPHSDSILQLQNEIRDSLLVNRLLEHRDNTGRLQFTPGAYGKWRRSDRLGWRQSKSAQ